MRARRKVSIALGATLLALAPATTVAADPTPTPTATATPTPSASPTPTPTSTPTPAPTKADAVVAAVSATEWARMVAVGAWHAGCPATRASLRHISVNYVGFDGLVHRGALVVNADVAPTVAYVFTRLFALKFPIHQLRPIEAFNGDDAASMAADNTSAYNCRRASQANASPAASPHANGRAIDLNPFENPWLDSRCGCYQPDAMYGTTRTGKGVITATSAVHQLFASVGWLWQDNSTPDFQHFDTGYPSRAYPPVVTNTGASSQLIVVQAHGVRAVVTAWQRTTTGWHRALASTNGFVGARGIVAGTKRVQGSNTTPAGRYAITQAFGTAPNPGTKLPYRHLGTYDWWVEDNASRYYNSMRSSRLGGFRTRLSTGDINASEHLITYRAYRYALVIDYNMHPAVRYRGAGIFLHLSTGQPTAGCVAVAQSPMVALLRWVTVSGHPLIDIT